MAKRKRLDLILGARDQASGVLGRVGGSLSNFVGRVAAGTTALVAFNVAAALKDGLASVVRFGISSSAAAEQAQVAFTTLLGSAEQAKAVLADLTQFAASTPFQLPGLTDAARSLVAFGVSSEAVVPTLRRIGDVAAGIGQPIGEIAEIYGKARVQGRLFMEDINQLTGRGIPIIQQLAAQFGVAESEVRELVSSGRVNFGHLEAAFASMTAEGGQFAGMMEAQSQTLAGKWSTLKDNVGLAVRDITTQVLEGFSFKGGLDRLILFTGRVKGLLIEVTAAVVPRLQALGAWVMDWVGRIAAFVLPSILQSIAITRSQIAFLVDVVSSAVSAVIGLFQPLLGSIGSFGSTLTNLRDTAIRASITMQYGFENWRAVVELATLAVGHAVVKLANQIHYFLTEVVPSVLEWLADNWREILTDIGNASKTFFTNLISNAAETIKRLPELLAGDIKLSDIWGDGLLDGFKATLTEAPKIAARQEGEWERILREQMEESKNGLGEGLDSFMRERLEQLNRQQDTIKKFFQLDLGGGGDGPEPIDPQQLLAPGGVTVPVTVEEDGSVSVEEPGARRRGRSGVQAVEITRQFLGIAGAFSAQQGAPELETAANTKKAADEAAKQTGFLRTIAAAMSSAAGGRAVPGLPLNLGRV